MGQIPATIKTIAFTVLILSFYCDVFFWHHLEYTFSCLSTILKIKDILDKKIKVKVYISQQNFVSDIQPPSCP